MQSTNSIFLVKPTSFAFNKQTAKSNVFQNEAKISENEIQKRALIEFNKLAKTLTQHGVEVLIFDDTVEPEKPDAIFPNNWISTHSQGVIILYPMMAKNRRLERREDILTDLKRKYKVKKVIDLSVFENEKKYLEGTGSVILDRIHKLAFACISPRTDKKLFKEYAEHIGYEPIYFSANDDNGKKIYHTNVIMTLGTHFVVICLDAIKSRFKRKFIKEKLLQTQRTVLEINQQQVKYFAGNMLELKNSKGETLIVMSSSAYKILKPTQKKILKQNGKLVIINIKTIESIGGGSVRCMIAENFLEKNRTKK